VRQEHIIAWTRQRERRHRNQSRTAGKMASCEFSTTLIDRGPRGDHENYSTNRRP